MTNLAENYAWTYAAWAEAMTIFEKYEPGEFAELGAEHECIYAGPNPEVVSAEDRERLDYLRWYEAAEYECFYHFV